MVFETTVFMDTSGQARVIVADSMVCPAGIGEPNGVVGKGYGSDVLQVGSTRLVHIPGQERRAASSPPGTPHSCGSGTGIVRFCRLKPAFRHRIAWGGELDAALQGAGTASSPVLDGPWEQEAGTKPSPPLSRIGPSLTLEAPP